MSLKNKILLIVIILEYTFIIFYIFNFSFNKKGHKTGYFFISDDCNEPLYPPMWGKKPINFTQFFDGYQVKLPEVTIVHFNWDGIRDYDNITMEKPENIIRILALGDSHTFGWGVNLEDTWPKQLEKLLNENANVRNVNKKYQLINFGLCGYGFTDYIKLLKEKGLKYNPDIVIIGFHHDDLGSIERYYDYVKEYKKRNLGLDNTEIEKIAAEKYYHHLFNNFEYYFNTSVFRASKELHNISKQYNFSVIFVFGVDIIGRNSKELVFENNYYNELSNLVKYNEFKLVYVTPRIKKLDKNKLILTRIDQHPTSFYHRIIAETIFGRLKT